MKLILTLFIMLLTSLSIPRSFFHTILQVITNMRRIIKSVTKSIIFIIENTEQPSLTD